ITRKVRRSMRVSSQVASRRIVGDTMPPMPVTSMTHSAPTRLVEGLVFGEGPRWRGDCLWFSDMHGEAVHTVDLDGRLETVVEVPGRRPSGLGVLPDRSLLVVSNLRHGDPRPG